MGVFFLLTYSLFVFTFSALLLSSSLITLFTCPVSDTFSPFECGFEPIGSSHVPFCIKFFLLAILFLLFDVEVAFLAPTLYSSSLMISFVLILFIGLIFEFAYGSLS